MPFHDDLVAATADARARLFTVPVITDCLAGRVTRPQYLAFLAEAYHHVKHTVPLLMACGARLPAEKAWLREAVADYIDEERGHDQWILDDISAAGGNAHAVRHGAPDAATEVMVAYVYDYIARCNPVGFFGMVFVLEGTSVAIALRAADAIEQAIGLPGTALRYLRSHGEADRRHVHFLATLLDRLDREEDHASVVHVAKVMYRLYAEVYRALPRASAVVEELTP
jgi:pyrroloquinoline quinone (PQQ) biosynthesis protein C